MTKKEGGSVLKLQELHTTVNAWFGTPEELDGLADFAGISVRVAPNELLVIGDIERPLHNDQNPPELFLDLSSAYALWALSGDQRFEAFSRISAINLPESGSAQGLVAHVPTKIVVRDGELLLIVPSVASHQLHDRLITACADLATAAEHPAAPVEESVLA